MKDDSSSAFTVIWHLQSNNSSLELTFWFTICGYPSQPYKGDQVDDQRVRDPLEEGEDKARKTGTSSNREESMTESGKDAFGDKSAVRNPDSTQQGDGTSDPADNTYIGRVGYQSPSDSGTTPLGGESRDQDSRIGPGGVEGDQGSR